MKIHALLSSVFLAASAFAIPATEKYVDEAIKENNVQIDLKLNTKIPFPQPYVPTDYVLTKTSTGVAWLEQKGGGGGGGGGQSLGPISYIKDDAGRMYLVKAMLNPAGQIVAAVEQVSTNVVLMTVEQEKNRATIAEGELKDSVSNEVVRATAVEADLDERITSMSAVGRFLSTWNCVTGRPGTEPKETRMAYKAGDYYIVGSVATSPTNYIPSGTVYTNGTASTAFTTDTVTVNDLFRHTDDGQWVHVSMAGVSVTFEKVSGDPRDNTKLAAEFALTDEAITNLLLEIERSFTADTNLLSLVTAETNRAQVAEAAIAADLLAETNRAQLVEAGLQAFIEAETNRAYTAETNLYDLVGIETNRAYTVETNLLDRITNEVVRAYTVETNLLDMIEVETNRAYTVETNLLDRITNEVVRAYTVETNLQAFIEAETNRAYVAETNIVANLIAETNRAYVAETNLQAYIESATNNVPRIIIGNSRIYADRRYKDILAPAWTPSQTEIPENPDPTSEYYKNVRFLSGGWRCDKYDYVLGYWHIAAVVSMVGDISNPDATVLNFPDYASTETRFVSESVDTLLATTNEVGEVKKIAEDEITRATAAEADLEQLWEDEADLRLQADNDLWVAHDTETNRAQVAEAAIAADLQAEVTRATQADTTIYTIATNKQDKLPPVINDKFLHVNAVSGNLEWAAAGSSGGGNVESGGKNLYVDAPSGNDSRESIRLDNLAKGYTVGHYKATLSAAESPSGVSEIGYYTITDLGDNDCYMEGRTKNGYGYWCKRKNGLWSDWSRETYIMTLNGSSTEGQALVIYAPTTSGSNGQVVQSDGTKAVWTTPTAYWNGTQLTLNGASKAAQSVGIYAPTGSGNAWQIPVSCGANNAPAWKTWAEAAKSKSKTVTIDGISCTMYKSGTIVVANFAGNPSTRQQSYVDVGTDYQTYDGAEVTGAIRDDYAQGGTPRFVYISGRYLSMSACGNAPSNYRGHLVWVCPNND